MAQSRRAQGAVPLSNPGGWIGTADYPAEALRAMREGSVGFTLEIGVDGVPKGCAIMQSSGDPSLDGATCTLISQRARFRPARDAAGRAVVGSFSNRVVWRVPRTEPQPQEGELVISYTVGTDGKLRDCRIEAASGSAAPAATAPSPCQLGMGTTPYRDAAGAPVARRVTMRHRVSVVPLP